PKDKSTSHFNTLTLHDALPIFPKLPVYPQVSSELLAEINVNQIGHYVTYYDEKNVERSHNILLSTLAINNHVIFPGEEFSFNQRSKEHTSELQSAFDLVCRLLL